MNTLFHPPAIEAPTPGEEQEDAGSSATELLLGMAFGVCALIAVRLAGYAVLAVAQLLKQLFDPG